MPAGGDIVNVADVNAAQAGSNLRPVCRLTQVAAGTNLVDSTNTAISFDGEDLDTHGFHSPSVNPTRITPTVAGVYRFYGTVMVPGAVDYLTLGACIAKNGTNQAVFTRIQPGATSAQRSVSATDTVLTMNGTTDYCELIGYQDNTANTAKVTSFSASSFTCTFGCEYVRQ